MHEILASALVRLRLHGARRKEMACLTWFVRMCASTRSCGISDGRSCT